MPVDARRFRRAGGEPSTETGALRPFMNVGGMDAAATEQARPVPNRAAGRGVTDSTRTPSDGLHCNDRPISDADSRDSRARAPTVHERRRHEAAVFLHACPHTDGGADTHTDARTVAVADTDTDTDTDAGAGAGAGVL